MNPGDFGSDRAQQKLGNFASLPIIVESTVTRRELHTTWDIAGSYVLFEIRYRGRIVLCRIEAWVLWGLFDTAGPRTKTEAMAAFEANRTQLKKLAVAKAERDEFEPDSSRPEGIIRLRANDLTDG
jgi:Protein of unknown function (DUF1488)